MKGSWQFRDQVIPARVFFLLKQGKLTTTDLLLLAVINSMVKPQWEKGEAGLGCFSGNKYLADAVNVHDTYVSQRLSYLSSLGIVIIINVRGKRYIELEWSRTAEERSELEGVYGKHLRRAYRKMYLNLQKPAEPLGKHEPPLGKPKAPPLGKPKHNNNEESISNNKTLEGPPNGERNGFLPLPAKKGRDAPSEQARYAARQVIDAYGRKTQSRLPEYTTFPGRNSSPVKVKLEWFMARQMDAMVRDRLNGDWNRVCRFNDHLNSKECNLRIKTIPHYERCLHTWEDVNAKIEWKRKGADGCWVWSQYIPPTAEDLDTGEWYPFRGGEPVPKDERQRMRKEIYDREGVTA